MKRSPVPLALRNAAFSSGSAEIFRPSSGVASMVSLSRRVPSSGSLRMPSVVPYTVTSLVPPVATSFTRTLAVSPARNAAAGISSVTKPDFATLTRYAPVTCSAVSVTEPSLPDTARRASPFAVLTADTLAPGTTAPL